MNVFEPLRRPGPPIGKGTSLTYPLREVIVGSDVTFLICRALGARARCALSTVCTQLHRDAGLIRLLRDAKAEHEQAVAQQLCNWSPAAGLVGCEITFTHSSQAWLDGRMRVLRSRDTWMVTSYNFANAEAEFRLVRPVADGAPLIDTEERPRAFPGPRWSECHNRFTVGRWWRKACTCQVQGLEFVEAFWTYDGNQGLVCGCQGTGFAEYIFKGRWQPPSVSPCRQWAHMHCARLRPQGPYASRQLRLRAPKRRETAAAAAPDAALAAADVAPEAAPAVPSAADAPDVWRS